MKTPFLLFSFQILSAGEDTKCTIFVNDTREKAGATLKGKKVVYAQKSQREKVFCVEAELL